MFYIKTEDFYVDITNDTLELTQIMNYTDHYPEKKLKSDCINEG